MKQPRYTGDNTERVENVDQARKWLVRDAMTPSQFRRTCFMFADHRKTLPLVLGKAHQHYLGEYRNHVWRMEHDGNIYWVFTSIRGTTVEWDKRGDPNKIPSFLKWFEEQCTEAMRQGDPEEFNKIMSIGN